jgi:hypothetical protein
MKLDGTAGREEGKKTMKWILCLSIIVGVSLGACTWDSEMTSASCPSGVAVGEPTEPAPLPQPGPDGDYSEPLDASDPCAPVTMSDAAPASEQPWACTAWWPDYHTERWVSTAPHPDDYGMAKHRCKEEMARKGAKTCDNCKHADDNSPRATSTSECTVLWSEDQCAVMGKPAGCTSAWQGDVPPELAEDRCDFIHGWPASGTKCSGCRSLGSVTPATEHWSCVAIGLCSSEGLSIVREWDGGLSVSEATEQTCDAFDAECIRGGGSGPDCRDVDCRRYPGAPIPNAHMSRPSRDR